CKRSRTSSIPYLYPIIINPIIVILARPRSICESHTGKCMKRGATAVAVTIQEMTGVEFPLFAFSHCRDVVAAVSRAGGFGVLGGSSFTPETLEQELAWIDDHVDGKPYGVDILIPEHQKLGLTASLDELVAQIPTKYVDFTVDLLQQHNISATDKDVVSSELPVTMPEVAEALMDVAFRHPIRLIVNALGIAPASMIERARKHGVPVGALVGAKEHAVRQVNAGVVLLDADCSDEGGYCVQVKTQVIATEVVISILTNRSMTTLELNRILTG